LAWLVWNIFILLTNQVVLIEFRQHQFLSTASESRPRALCDVEAIYGVAETAHQQANSGQLSQAFKLEELYPCPLSLILNFKSTILLNYRATFVTVLFHEPVFEVISLRIFALSKA
jgi:hypothetical protein